MIRRVFVGLIAISFTAGWLGDRAIERHAPLTLGGYRVLSADFHVHPAPWSAATLSPWDLALEAQRQGLDAFAMASQDHLWVSKVGRWASELLGGPMVLVSEEVHTPKFHMIAVGIREAVDWRLTAAQAIAEIHRQGGVAIAAHPIKQYWVGWDADAMRELDAAEIVHPLLFQEPEKKAELEEFFHRQRFSGKPLTAIGSSDFHAGFSPGLCRTYVFARENTRDAIVEALREGRTVVYGLDGQAYGDPKLIEMAAGVAGLKERALKPVGGGGAWAVVSRVCGVIGMLGMVLFGWRRRESGW